MLKALIAKLSKNLFRKKYNPGFKTRIYPTLGESILIHDTLDFSPTSKSKNNEYSKELWLDDKTDDIFTQTND